MHINKTNPSHQATGKEPGRLMAEKRPEATRPILGRIALPLTITGIVIAAILLIALRERPSMTSSATPSETASGIPPIDRDAPTNTKTATFAMG
jgi:hypothetical protein